MKILTFDIEEWFHILDNESTKTESEWAKYEVRIHKNMDLIFRMLEDTKQSATFFCLGWIAEKYPEVICRIADANYEIGTHSNRHQLVYEQSKSEFKNDLERSIKTLEDCIGKKVTLYRAPGFSITPNITWAFEEIINQGITTDCSVFPAPRAHGGFENFGVAKPCYIDINGMKLKEFPINLHSFVGKPIIFSGGGYFRFLPYGQIKKWTQASEYVMTYFHPRDFDYEQPLIKELGIGRRFKSYYGLKQCEPKLRNMLQDFEFVDLKTADAMVNWERVETIKM